MASETSPTRAPLVGSGVRQLGSERFVRGRGEYLADVHRPGERHVAILRSSRPHARISSIDTSAAEAMSGVRCVITGRDVYDSTWPHNFLWALPGQQDGQTRCLAYNIVRYVGEPIAAVVADTLALAEDARARIVVTYQQLPTIHTIDEALAPDAPLLHPHWGSNVVARSEWTAGDVTAGLAASAVVIHESFSTQRLTATPLETRGVIAEADPTGNLTVWTSTQGIHLVRETLSTMLGVREHRIRVIAPDVGGAFGLKAVMALEEAIVAFLALRLGGPVRWIEDRRESFVASQHARAETVEMEMGFAADGRILALRARNILEIGGCPGPCGAGSAWVTAAVLCGPYRITAIDFLARAVVTNKTPTGAYRGYGQPEAYFPLERTIELGARRLGMDPNDVRRTNLVTPEELPYPSATGLVLDSGRYADLLDLTEQRVNHARTPAPAPGWRRGEGWGFFTEVTNFGPSGIVQALGVDQPGWDTSVVRVEPSGTVRVLTSQTMMGQGADTALAQTCADVLQIPLESVTVTSGDTLSSPYTGYTSGGSRSAGIAGSSVIVAAGRVRDKMIRIAAHEMEADPQDVELLDGRFAVRGAPDTGLNFEAVARLAYRAVALPPDVEPGLEIVGAFDPTGIGISYGVAAVEVDVSELTGEIVVRRVVFGHDCGIQLNPRIVEGQVTGAIVQGIAATLHESLDYDSDGQPLVENMAQYGLPTADLVPTIELLHIETPCPTSLNGAKGAGECGIIPMPAAIANAVQNALPTEAPIITRLPIRPEWLLDALQPLGEGNHP